MNVLAIDPGTEQSAWVLYDGARVVGHDIEANRTLMMRLRDRWFTDVAAVVLEQVESYGMAVGREVFETVFWTGRFYQAATAYGAGIAHLRPRRTVKLHLCESAKAKDSNIRVALIDRFGGKEKAIGLKRTQGPLYGVKSHEWSALAIAVTYFDQQQLSRKVG